MAFIREITYLWGYLPSLIDFWNATLQVKALFESKDLLTMEGERQESSLTTGHRNVASKSDLVHFYHSFNVHILIQFYAPIILNLSLPR